MEGKLTYRQTRPLVMVTEWELIKVWARWDYWDHQRVKGLWKLSVASLKEQ